jgi:hypothetical protein
MDPLERADAALARARARGAFVVTPESAVSPMDAANTLQIPRIVVSDNDQLRPDPDAATLVVPFSEVAAGVARQDSIPAIAQESFTDVVSSPPGIRSRQRRIEDARARAAAPRQPAPEQEATPAPAPAKPHPEEMDGVIPTTQQPPPSPGSLSERLDG